jgi:hypothetical protein
MRKLECGRLEPLLALAAGGDLPTAQSLLLEEHLRGCEGCRRSLAAFDATVHTIRELPASPFSPNENAELRRRVWSRIEHDRRRTTFGRRGLSWNTAALAAAAALALLALLLPWRPTRHPAPPAGRDRIAAVSPPAAGVLPLPTRDAPAPAPAPRIARRRAPRHPGRIAEPAEPVRIELSTPDPDVRIVWLVGPAADQELPLLPDVFATAGATDTEVPPDTTKEDPR